MAANRAHIWDNVQVARFGTEHGLPEGDVRIYDINGTLYFPTLDSIYRFDDTIQRFVIDSTFMVGPSGSNWTIHQDKLGRVWVAGNKLALGTALADGSYQWLEASFRRFSGESIYNIYSEEC